MDAKDSAAAEKDNISIELKKEITGKPAWSACGWFCQVVRPFVINKLQNPEEEERNLQA